MIGVRPHRRARECLGRPFLALPSLVFVLGGRRTTVPYCVYSSAKYSQLAVRCDDANNNIGV
jgi:hypothetical protein